MRFFEAQEKARAQTLRLLILFGLAVLALVLAINGALALTWRLVSPGFAGYPAWFFTVNTAVTLLFVLGGWWLETSALQAGGVALARQAGAREAWPASQEAERRLCNIVSELAVAASMKAPQAMVLPQVNSINAFAAGWNADDSVVAVTQGALDRLSRDELQGLLAHEFSHLREGDTRLNMQLAGMVYGLEMVFTLGQRMCELDDQGNRYFLALPGFAIMATGSLGWLAGVLRKVASEQAGSRQILGTKAYSLHPAVHHMLLVSANTRGRWFASHPPLAERIRRIYGRPMPALPVQQADEMPTRPDAFF